MQHLPTLAVVPSLELPLTQEAVVPLRGTHSLAVYELTVVDGSFVERPALATAPFDYSAYSEFKYGRRDTAERFGMQIADVLIPRYAFTVPRNEPIVVIGTPYKRVPNAARMLAITAERVMRRAGLPSSYSYIYQHRLAAGDYGTLSIAEREQRNKQKKRYLDEDDFIGKHVVLIDDVRITGSIERSITAMLADIPTLSLTTVSFVLLDPEVAHANPGLEDKLNHLVVNGIKDLARLMKQHDRFVLTTRAVKFILEAEPRDVSWLTSHLSVMQLAELYEAIVDEGYDLMPRYAETFRIVCNNHHPSTR